jgi:hypothetical protein
VSGATEPSEESSGLPIEVDAWEKEASREESEATTMAGTLPAEGGDRRRFGRATLVLGTTSIALVVGSFFFVPWGWQLGSLAAIVALACGGLALKYRRGDTASALIGISLALVVVLFGVLLILIFAFTPGD